jgi:Uma2 family endonuclease
MAQLLETTEVAPVRGAKLWPMSVEAYHVLGEAGVIPENTELLHGLVYTKMPKSPFHWFLLQRLLEAIRQLNLPGILVRSEQPLTFTDSEPEPDIALIKGSANEFRFNHPVTAELVIEVCVSSHEYDRSKLRAHALAGVKECWLVLGPEKKVETYSRPKNGSYERQVVHGVGEVVKSEVVSDVTWDVAGVFS